MKKVVFQTCKNHQAIKEEAEYDYNVTDEEIKRDFMEWVCGKHDCSWYVKEEE